MPVDLAVNTNLLLLPPVETFVISTTSDNFVSPAVTSFSSEIKLSIVLPLAAVQSCFTTDDISNVVPSTFIVVLLVAVIFLPVQFPVSTFADAASVIFELELDPAPPFNNFWVLNSVLLAILSTSSVNASISFWISFLSLDVFVSFDACTANSLILWRILVVSFNAPSAVWIIEIPSEAFLEAWVNPLICPLIFSDIARPAASSPALLILKPEDNFSIDFPALVLLTPMFLCAFNAFILWLIIIVVFLLDFPWHPCL